ncbi:MAG: ribonuclease Z [Bacteroidota bacterium]|nr:ribonuclease Z [Bacteroidota bacterium]MDP4272717.1 ribonuclease Z [Bacteroidota bacterium]
MSFSVTILGSSSALPTSRRFTSAHLLNADEHFFLIDCGEGTQMQLRRYNVPFLKINHIFISHLHGDHTFGLIGLLSSYILLERKNDLHIYAYSELKKLLNPYIRFYLNDITFKIIFHDLDVRKNSVIYEDKILTVETIPLKHRIETCGFLFREKQKDLNIRKEYVQEYGLSIKDIQNIKKGGDFQSDGGEVIPNKILTFPPFHPRSYAYCSDTVFDESVIPLVSQVDLLYHEATYCNKDLARARKNYHSTSSQAATIASKAGVKKLILGHFSARYKDILPLLKEAQAIFPNTSVVNDGDCFDVPLEREIIG